MIKLDFRSGIKNLTSSLVRNPTPTPPKNLRLPAPPTPTLEPCLQVIFVPKEFLLKEESQHGTRESIRTSNPTKILGKQFWKNWRVTRSANRVQPGNCPS